MNARRTSQVLVLLVGLFGVAAFVCACRSNRPRDPFASYEVTEFPKLSESENAAFNILNQ